MYGTANLTGILILNMVHFVFYINENIREFLHVKWVKFIILNFRLVEEHAAIYNLGH